MRFSMGCCASAAIALSLLFSLWGGAVSFAQSASSTVASAASCPALPYLAPGESDATTHGEVSLLQNFLMGAVASSSLTQATGYFGSVTEKTLRAFQTLSDIATSGVLDANTRSAILASCDGGDTADLAATSTLSISTTPSVTFNEGAFTSLRADPTISGTAANVSGPLSLTIQPVDASGLEAAVFTANAVSVVNGAWSAHIVPPLPIGQYLVSVSSNDGTLLGLEPFAIGLVSYPTITPDFSLPIFDVADGRLMRFAIKASVAGPISIGQLSFSVATTSTDVAPMSLYAYTDNAFSQPISTSTGGLLNATPVDPSTGHFSIVFDTPLLIPAGETYFFELDTAVTPSGEPYVITTTLLGDPPTDTPTLGLLSNVASSSNIAWSPDTFDVSSTTDADWGNGALIDNGFSVFGLREVRTSPPITLPPTCTMTADQTVVAPLTPVTIDWSSTGASYATWDNGSKDLPSGEKVVIPATLPHLYTLTFTGPYGVTECYVPVTAIPPVAPPPATTTPPVATTTPPVATTTPDSFTASVASGTVPLSVTFKGTVNNSLSCAASTYSFGYGDKSTSTIAVAAKLCKAQSFTLTHSYSVVGTYKAQLYFGTFAKGTTTPLIETQTITVKAKTAFAPNGFSGLANALVATLTWNVSAITDFFRALTRG